MCTLVQIVRVVILAVACCSAALANMRPSGAPPSAAGEQAQRPQTQTDEKSGFARSPLGSLAGLPAPNRDAGAPNEPFGLPTVAPRGEISLKWRELQSRIDVDMEAVANCRVHATACSQAIRRFLSIVELGKGQEGRRQLGWINRAVNLSISPMSDWAQYGYADVWASPLQTLRSGAGDCEDYATVKYAVLRELGFSTNDLRLVILQDSKLQVEHAVVAVRYEGKWSILDNRTMAILDTEQTQNYRALFALDWQNDRPIKTASLTQLTDR
ncbi:MAG TPA: transglutaminase-like cysteine peptidase [Lacipirellulaceae bacterium]|nr:transglutaminase-like cysteine peptidase [Lacipirellulaceae bacterium]